jgi:exodeoxyribonuclease VII large subunit
VAKPVKSQWDFGELFPPEQVRKVLSVTELTWQVRRLLEKEVGAVWVTGEISNLSVQRSGHIYFTLKDAGAQLNCVLFRTENQVDRGAIADGRKVLVGGDLTVYEPRGLYQLRVTAIELQGVGALQVAFEKLKQKLKAEGLFEPGRKRELPAFPERIGVVTSPTGAAIRDVLHVVQRRNPALEIVLAPCRVQGESAAGEVAAAIRLLNEYHSRLLNTGQPRGLDLILVTRGGGSLEDLWIFNEEAVARAIFESSLPVVSAVGHEIDFTISDFVADVRAATPSAAAEILTEGVFSSSQFIADAAARIGQLARQRLSSIASDLRQTGQRLLRVHPRRRLNESLQRWDDLQTSLSRGVRTGLRQQQIACSHLVERLQRLRPALLVERRRDTLNRFIQQLSERIQYRLGEVRNRFTRADERLRLLGPEQVLARGYSITTDARSGAVVRQATQVMPGQLLRTRLHAGEVRSRAEP